MIAGSPRSSADTPRVITVAILAMGGEGGGVLADWLVDLAEHAGYYAQTTSVPGVAQRTGATIYYLEIFPEAAARAAHKEPVLALMPVPGELDVVIASELMEAGRAVQRGLVTPDRTTMIASTNRVYSMTERTALGDGRADSETLIAAGRSAARRFVSADFAQIAEDTGSVISAPLLGAVARAEVLPFSRTQFEDAIRRGGVGVEASLTAFAAGFAAAGAPQDLPSGPPVQLTRAPQATAHASGGPRVVALLGQVQATFPAACHAILQTAVVRLTDYQDERYGAEYLSRLDAIRDLDVKFGPGSFPLLCEAGRQLALWMSYEDAIRVADLKIRRNRFDRVQRESRAGSKQLMQINEFLHPRLQEIADILPAGLGRWLLATGWVRAPVERVTRKGRIVRTTTLLGFLQLYLLAGLRPLRRRSLRFLDEQRRIGDWLARLAEVTREDYALALEIAECPGLLKGYGDTHLRGRKHFDTLVDSLPAIRRSSNPAARLRALREAALADDSGSALATALAAAATAAPSSRTVAQVSP
jgi:indolepyruvate ferredoxin oxidoreductase beta subunit